MTIHEPKPSSDEDAQKTQTIVSREAMVTSPQTIDAPSEAEQPIEENTKVELDRTELYLKGPTAFSA